MAQLAGLPLRRLLLAALLLCLLSSPLLVRAAAEPELSADSTPPRFPDDSFAAVREAIAPMKLGLWMSPMHFNPASTTFKAHPEWACAPLGLVADAARTTYYLGRETLVPSKRKGMMRWRKQLFAFVSRNAQSAPLYFGLPPNRVVELGMQVEI